jgi:hypothetical protein
MFPIRICIWAAVFCTTGLSQAASTLLASSSRNWTVVPGNFDFHNDQQTGNAASDIVGSDDDPGFFIGFMSGTDPAGGGGQLAFRVRLDAPGGPPPRPAFDRILWLGLDADQNGAIDAFLSVNRQGNNSALEIYGAGDTDNRSPSTTSIAKSPFYRTDISVSNFHYRPVDLALDGGTTDDLGLNETDYYLSFAMPFDRIVEFLELRDISVNDRTPLRFVVATSTQTNALNQDLGGIHGGTDSSESWESLGGFSPLEGAADSEFVPEVRSSALVLIAFPLLAARRRRDKPTSPVIG